MFVEEVPVHRHGDSETDLVGLVNIPNQFVQNEGEDTDDSDTESVAGSVRQEDTASVVEDPAEVAVPPAFMNEGTRRFGVESHPAQSARQALEGAALAPGNQATLRQLTDATRRPPRLSKKGAAAGPSGMTCEHLRPLLPDVRGSHLLFQISQRMARGQVPEAVINIIRMGRLTALSKPDGEVRGIVAGDVVRHLVARTMSQQLIEPCSWTSHQPVSICRDHTGRVRVCGARVARVDGNRPTSDRHVH